MKIVFVNIKVHTLDTNFFNPSIAALAASLHRAGFASQVINVNYKKDLNKFADEISQIQPDLVLFSVMSVNWELVKELARIAKEKAGSYNICGGYHPTLYPEEVLLKREISSNRLTFMVHTSLSPRSPRHIMKNSTGADIHED